jgi:crotonobetainyl-CoA:carnitine CoA-transferase CaiB-like acyl-CoA transferase
VNPSSGSGPLEGIRVLDLGTRIAAPFCSGLLGEMGADVIKVEEPVSGDFMRHIGPFEDGYSLFWSVEGRGRRSVTLDLREPDGQEALRRLAATADILVENFRPGTLERWNIGPDRLDDRLVVVRISQFGQDGPRSNQPGLDRLGLAFGGLLHITGFPDGPPIRPGITMSDYLTGTFAALAAVVAVRDQERTGRGCVVDASLYGSIMRVMEWTFAGYDRLGTVRSRHGNQVPHSAPVDTYRAADGRYVCVVAASDTNFRRLAKALNRPELTADPRYATLRDRGEHSDELNSMVAAWCAGLTAAEIEARCLDAGVPAAVVRSVDEIVDDPHVKWREDLVHVDDPQLGPVLQQAPQPRLSTMARRAPKGAPRLGEDNDAVWPEIIGADEYRRLRKRGII